MKDKMLATGFGAALMFAQVSFGAGLSSDQDAFFTSLQALCGKQFVGAMTFPEDGQDAFAGKELVADVARCGDSELRIPFSVGEDRSRTWVLTRTRGGLRLKHDHRHDDGSPHEITWYGGLALEGGNDLSQSFAADALTTKMIPEAKTNVWTLSLSAEGEALTYYLERHEKPRFEAKLFLLVDAEDDTPKQNLPAE